MASRNTPLYEQVVRELRNQIISGRYKKGEPLPSEKELIDSMVVSRITVRRAIHILSEMGLIETNQGKNSVVVFDAESVAEDQSLAAYVDEYVENFHAVEQIRLMLEPEVARQVAKTASEKDVARLEAALRGGEASQDAAVSNDFHRALIEVLANGELLQIYDHLISMEEGHAPRGVLSPEKQDEISAQVLEQHKRIMRAIREHDPEFAYFYMKDHLRFVAQIYERHFHYLQ